jgi:hypothetical protein
LHNHAAFDGVSVWFATNRLLDTWDCLLNGSAVTNMLSLSFEDPWSINSAPNHIFDSDDTLSPLMSDIPPSIRPERSTFKTHFEHINPTETRTYLNKCHELDVTIQAVLCTAAILAHPHDDDCPVIGIQVPVNMRSHFGLSRESQCAASSGLYWKHAIDYDMTILALARAITKHLRSDNTETLRSWIALANSESDEDQYKLPYYTFGVSSLGRSLLTYQPTSLRLESVKFNSMSYLLPHATAHHFTHVHTALDQLEYSFTYTTGPGGLSEMQALEYSLKQWTEFKQFITGYDRLLRDCC